MAINRPFKAGLLLKGAYTLSKAKNETDDDGWVGWTGISRRSCPATSRSPATTGPTTSRWASSMTCPIAKGSSNPVAMIVRDWQMNGVYSFYSGTPFTIGGDNTALNQRGGTQTIDLIAPLQRVGDPGPNEVVLQPGIVRPAGQQVGQHGTQPVPRAQRVQPRHGTVPWLPDRTLPR